MNKLTKSAETDRLFTDLFFEQDIQRSVESAKKEITQILLDLKSGSSVFSYSQQKVTAFPCDFPRLLVEWNRSSSLDHSIRSVIVSALLSAEEKSSGSGLLAAGMWIVGEEYKTQSPKIKRSTHNEIVKCLSYFGGTGMSRYAAQAVIDLGGIGHRVEYAETSNAASSITLIEGKEILGSVDSLFSDRVGHEFSLSGCAVVAIDGTVESVSSVHRLLEESSERPIVVLALNFLPDVSSTMAATWAAGRGKCLPFRVSSWSCDNFLELESIGIKCISHERGDIVSTVSSQNSNGIDLEIQSTHLIVRSNNDLDRSKITVRVSKTLGGLTGVALDRVKTLVSHARSGARFGVIKWEELQGLSERLSDLYSRDLAVPWSSLAGASKACLSLTEILQNLACLITVKRGEKL